MYNNLSYIPAGLQRNKILPDNKIAAALRTKGIFPFPVNIKPNNNSRSRTKATSEKYEKKYMQHTAQATSVQWKA